MKPQDNPNRDGAIPPAGDPSLDPERELLRTLRSARAYLEKLANIVELLLNNSEARKLFLAHRKSASDRSADPLVRRFTFVEAVELVRVAKKSRRHTFRIGGKVIEVSRGLGELLAALAEDSTASMDALVGWKEVGPLKKKLRVTTAALNGRLSRLRDALDRHPPLSRALLRRDGEYGLRFAVLRMKRGGE